MNAPEQRRFEGTMTTALAGTGVDAAVTIEEDTTTVPVAKSKEGLWNVVGLYTTMTTNGGATAATWSFRISEAAGWTANDQNERYTNLLQPVALPGIKESTGTLGRLTVKADANGQIHLRATANAAAGAGTSHIWTYALDLERAQGR